jgi:hypothetical protein
MKKLRQLHLYLGCSFAPLLIFFSISGIWQMLDVRCEALAFLSTIHTGRELKTGGTLSSTVMEWLAIAMALSLILTIILGVVMAFKFGRKKGALICLSMGIAIPLLAAMVQYSIHQ